MKGVVKITGKTTMTLMKSLKEKQFPRGIKSKKKKNAECIMK